MLLSTRYDDPYDQARSAIDRFNWGVHAEDFVMPLTGYVHHDPIERRKDEDFSKTPPDALKAIKTLNERVDEAPKAAGFAVNKHTLQDGSKAVTKLTTTVAEPSEDQLAPQYS